MKLHQKRKSMKYWRIGQIVYSYFLIENWKVKTLGTIIAYIDIQKLNERCKKMLNAKLKCHLARPHTLPYEVSAYIYIYIDLRNIWLSLHWLPVFSCSTRPLLWVWGVTSVPCPLLVEHMGWAHAKNLKETDSLPFKPYFLNLPNTLHVLGPCLKE